MCPKMFAVFLSMILAFVVGVVAANHCPLVAHLSGGPCDKIIKQCCHKDCCHHDHDCHHDCCDCCGCGCKK